MGEALEIRTVRDEEFAAWFDTESLGFGDQPPSPADHATELATAERDRWHAAFAGDRLVGTAGAYSFELTLPGGGMVPVGGVTGVTVLPFRHAASGRVNIIYRRSDGNIGWLDPAGEDKAKASS